MKTRLPEEQHFIYRDSFNRGFVQLPSTVVNCIGLSAGAKSVYAAILNHVHTRGNYAFPSIDRLSIALGFSQNTCTKHIEELVQKGFIKRVRLGRGRSNQYSLMEISSIPLLRVSEEIWTAAAKWTTLYGWDDIHSAVIKLKDFLSSQKVPLHALAVGRGSHQSYSAIFEKLLKGDAIDMGMLPKSIQNSVVPPKITNPPEHIQVKGNEDKTHWSVMPIEKWKVKQFREYYYSKYLDHMKASHHSNMKKHTGQMRRVLGMLSDNNLLKQYIDAVFEIGYENVTLEYFSSTTRLGEIQNYLANGTKPFHIKNNEIEKLGDIPAEGEARQRVDGVDALNKLLGAKDNE
ncbi:helix-turn-helix domain-containing protein [Bacillus pumilus]|uniref:helix-turn-helix domain-containing protein n=1 Tax=Bacillus TaxID=1386 RepID=UPI0009653586|nr:helix-turn-helix domain-containing protein [Bacillus pumilus]MBU8576438.1 helix-turn-helix domain-containing protein [Bacillus pumilus]OLP64362.1 hypothetical protein BACPU_25870 [Bacillus pumilus]